MAGKITLSSGTEGLTSVGIQQVINSLGGGTEVSTEGFDRSAVLAQFFAVGTTQEEVISAASESLAGISLPQADAQCGCQDGKRPALVSRVIDATDGHAEVTIVYDANPFTGGGDLSTICAILNAAAENDVIDITIAKCLCDFAHPRSSLFNSRALISAIDCCKGKVITRIGTVTSVDELAVWLSGDECHMSPMGWICIRQTEYCGGGTLSDMADRSTVMKEQVQDFIDYVVGKGWFSNEEFEKLFEEQSVLSMAFDDIEKKMRGTK